MIPGTVLLLGPASWGLLPDGLEAAGLDVLAVAADDPNLQRHLTSVVIGVRTAHPVDPLVLLATSSTGALLPDIGRALVTAGHRVGGYVFVDASLPGRADAGLLDPVQLGDWPDAPCGYLVAHGHAAEARLARLRGWPVVTSDPMSLAAGVVALIEAM
jgi:hypothetical protein